MTQFFDGGDFKAACTMLTGEPPPKPNGKARAEPKKIVAERFDYPDADGKLLLQVERVEFLKADGTFVITKDGKSKKTFRQRQPDPERPGEWIWNVEGVAPIPYRLPELIEAVGNKQTNNPHRRRRSQSQSAALVECARDVLRYGRGEVEARA